jgi:phosphoribosylformylglycinamidine synthase PurS subunit
VSRFDVMVEVSLRPGIADPEGSTIERALPALGFSTVHGVRMGKAIRFAVEAEHEREARRTAEELCRRLLANPVIEDARVDVALRPGEAVP